MSKKYIRMCCLENIYYSYNRTGKAACDCGQDWKVMD